MNIFYTPDISGKLYALDETESKHCVKVLRLSIGDNIHLIDGKGGLYTAEIVEDKPKACIVKIVENKQGWGKRNYHLHIAIAPTKNIDRFENFLEKATEIGIDEITPILSDNSERKIIKPERLNKILVAAAKQSINAFVPKLNPITTFSEFASRNFDEEKFIAHCFDGPKGKLKDELSLKGSCIILIGPEGDFSKSEVAKSKSLGWKEVTLGDSRLRTETAGIVACHTVSLVNF